VVLTGSTMAATATLSVNPTNISFGSVNLGSAPTQTVTLTNTGNSSVTISQINVSGAGFMLSGAGVPVTLLPSQSVPVSVQFDPSVAGAVNGSVSVVSNATGLSAAVTLSGTGAAATAHSVQISWTGSSSTVAGYNVYRTQTSGSGYTLINGGLVSLDDYSDTTVQSGQTYYYVATAVDGSGNESAYSNEAQAIVP
jgi:archaellum component FlaF (FlaF/FlaG flagellin family)